MPRLLVTGGSQGARSLNNALVDALEAEPLSAFDEGPVARVGAILKLREGDRAVFIGDMGSYMLEGALEVGNLESQMQRVERSEEVKPLMMEFEGAIFLKGSRYYALEKLVENICEEGGKAC